MNKNDLRFQKTEDNIRDSFLYCVDTIGFEKTKISDICNKARISRNTFYVHYEDKYSLMKSIYNDFERKMLYSFEENLKLGLYDYYTVEGSVNWCIAEISKNRELLRILLKCSKSELREVLGKVFIDKPSEKVDSRRKKKNESIEVTLTKSYRINALVGFIETWLDNYDKISEKKVAALMTELCSVPVEKYFDKVL